MLTVLLTVVHVVTRVKTRKFKVGVLRIAIWNVSDAVVCFIVSLPILAPWKSLLSRFIWQWPSGLYDVPQGIEIQDTGYLIISGLERLERHSAGVLGYVIISNKRR
jgi:hypothetical protein